MSVPRKELIDALLEEREKRKAQLKAIDDLLNLYRIEHPYLFTKPKKDLTSILENAKPKPKT